MDAGSGQQAGGDGGEGEIAHGGKEIVGVGRILVSQYDELVTPSHRRRPVEPRRADHELK